MKRTLTLPIILGMLVSSSPSQNNVHGQDGSQRDLGLEDSVHLLTQAGRVTAQKMAQKYSALLKDIGAKRKRLQAKYQQARTKAQQDSILGEAGDLLFSSLADHIFPAWDGTPWAFNGTSETPGEGEIACGYFVATTLRDAGFQLPRVLLARQPAEYIIQNLVEKDQIRRYSKVDIKKVEREVRAWGKGVYIAGLDLHVGFIVNKGRDLSFVHSSYYNPPLCVVSEPIDSSNPLADSNYRVIGKLDTTAVLHWLLGEKIPLRFDYFAK